MPLLTAQAEKLSLDDLRSGIIDEIVTTDELFQIMPFRPVDGKAYVYNREETLVEGDFVDTNDNINEGAATFTEVTQKVKRIVGDVDVDDFLDEALSDTNDQAQIQISKKSKGIARKYQRALINGNETTNPKEFNGLLNLATAPQTINAGANGGPLQFAHLDALMDLVKIKSGQWVFLMNSRTTQAYAALCRAMGGSTIPTITLPGVVGPMMEYRGVPILKNDYIPIDQTQGTETAATSIFLACLDENEGLCGLNTRRNAGIFLKVVGPHQTKDATRYRLRFYAALALHSTLALAMCEGINN